MDRGIIAPQTVSRKEDFNFSSNQGLLYKSNKFILSRGQVYPSKAAFEKGISSNSLTPVISPIIDSPSFWEEMEYFCILSK
jgi:hypothetical protein